MAGQEGATATAAPAEPFKSSLPGPDAVSTALTDEQPRTEGGGDPQPQPKDAAPAAPAAAPAGDDEDAAFFTANPGLPPGVRTRLQKLQQQRDEARKGVDGYKFFEPYNHDKGRNYLRGLVEFDGKLADSLENRPWLKQLLMDQVLEGKTADRKTLMQFLNQHFPEVAAAQGAEVEEGSEVAAPNPQVTQLEQRLAAIEEARQKDTFSREVQDHKASLKTEIAAYEKEHPEFAGNADFIRAGIREALAANSSFKDAADRLLGLFDGLHKSRLKTQATAAQEAQGAGTQRTGAPGVHLNERPKIGSDEQRRMMLESYGINDD